MVGSMETMASSVVSREMVVFLQDTRVRAAPLNGPRAREGPGPGPTGPGPPAPPPATGFVHRSSGEAVWPQVV